MKQSILWWVLCGVVVGAALYMLVYSYTNKPNVAPQSHSGYESIIIDLIESHLEKEKELKQCREDLETCETEPNPNCTDDSCNLR